MIFWSVQHYLLQEMENDEEIEDDEIIVVLNIFNV